MHNPVNETRCKTCEKLIKPKTKFCGKSCAAKFNNTGRIQSDEANEKRSKKLYGKVKNPDRLLDTFQAYYHSTIFRIPERKYHLLKGYDLFLKLGSYHHIKNPGGVAKDHRISRMYGFKNNIPAEYIVHPANCEFLLHKENAVKGADCSISLEQLMEEIKLWDETHKK